jgi:hypothetical protein
VSGQRRQSFAGSPMIGSECWCFEHEPGNRCIPTRAHKRNLSCEKREGSGETLVRGRARAWQSIAEVEERPVRFRVSWVVRRCQVFQGRVSRRRSRAVGVAACSFRVARACMFRKERRGRGARKRGHQRRVILGCRTEDNAERFSGVASRSGPSVVKRRSPSWFSHVSRRKFGCRSLTIGLHSVDSSCLLVGSSFSRSPPDLVLAEPWRGNARRGEARMNRAHRAFACVTHHESMTSPVEVSNLPRRIDTRRFGVRVFHR